MLIVGLVLIVAGIGVSLTPIRARLRAAIAAACVLGGIELVLIDVLSGSVRLAICIPLGVLFASLVGLILVVEQQAGPGHPDPAGDHPTSATDAVRPGTVRFQSAKAGGGSGGPVAQLLGAPAVRPGDGDFVSIVQFGVQRADAAATMRLEAEATSILDLRLSPGPFGSDGDSLAANERVAHFRAAITVRAPLAERYQAEIRTSRQELVHVTVSFTSANPDRARVSWMRRHPFPEIRIRTADVPPPVAILIRREPILIRREPILTR